jgi:hypothetical protein
MFIIQTKLQMSGSPLTIPKASLVYQLGQGLAHRWICAATFHSL